MEVIAFIKSVVYAMLFTTILIYKNLKKMKKVISWVKNLFASKKPKANETKVSPNSIPDPKGKPKNPPR